ncbi:DUF4136 domain-containing protein [Ornithobacterium rhinotracheale]|uniref:DUF4136 domain-containing protein n=1 Tax=Ornithobacterium rhinotracheale (strain ATCC 51463 / DSM 15997 / CCUG 23171 / CIP 104009 / LMG 9086) TaxID=867902 RepID=I4A1P1_ORNRL|nr:DUF4136 domain-containing protein [Ornithobacterium rhinotracheale]AFL97875.1 hypothetical protein Ornrh_1720 [Ornithobacterium rhinotracheale DSM 15997]AIP99693.1 hypothetical protein Q785_08450 [Ornithobacterium rhinotracheale ORT-UMN 88]KGB66200.1 hypothetical protein Q787_08260 [Ornithobacterium rhinotracheale H06-030791]MCK0193831.1 DUF4136 domain-containing protein [Ornithobacterium rhinotracheale]MCK0199447.1 DUF4136 domain-containing protein [Ornithobacterium rhinotracheale]
MNKYLSIIGMIMLLALTSCGTVSVSSDYDRNVNFQQFKTFAFHEKGLNNLKMNDLDKRRVVAAVQQNLEEKGLTMANSENSADLIVNLVAKTQKHVNVDVDPWYNPWWAGLWGPYGYNGYWGAPNVRKYHDGTLIIDLVNRKNNTLVWQGMGEGLNLYKLSDKVERIPKAVNEILYFYPPKK